MTAGVVVVYSKSATFARKENRWILGMGDPDVDVTSIRTGDHQKREAHDRANLNPASDTTGSSALFRIMHLPGVIATAFFFCEHRT